MTTANAARPMHWLLLRGLTREARHWGTFPAGFARTVPGAVPFTVDLPGAGSEHTGVVPTTIAGMTDDIRARFLRDRPAEGPWSVLAASLGGMIVLDWAARYPADFERAVVINTSSADTSSVWERFRFRQIPNLLAGVAAKPFRRELRILGMTTRSPTLDRQALAREWAGYAADRPVARTALVRQLYAASRSTLPHAAGVPTLVLTSRGDALVSPECSERIARKLNLPIRRHDWAGHDLPLDAPEWVAEQVAGWLSETGAGSPPVGSEDRAG